MVNKGFVRNIRPLEILTEEQIQAVHRGTLEVLEQTGVKFDSEKALKLLERHGCQVDYEDRRVKFPPGLVEQCLHKCPSSFHLRARNPENNLNIGGNTVYFGAFPGMRTVDTDTWKQRVPTMQENHDAVKVLDALDTIHLQTSYSPYCEIKDIPPIMALPASCASRMKYFTKISRVGQNKESERWGIKMAKVVDTDVIGCCECSSPLFWSEDAVNCTFRCAQAGFPIEINSAGVMGGTSPVTIAGSLVTSSAEIASAIVMVQLINPGLGVVVNPFIVPMEMRGGTLGFGSAGSFLHQVAFNQIWRSYRIPIWNATSGCSNSKRIDFQAAYEKGLNALLSALSGANIILFHGGIYAELTYHSIQAVLDHDVARTIGRFIEGIEVTNEKLAIDLIDKVGPLPGTFLDQGHTRKWYRKEGNFVQEVADVLSYPEWIKRGKKSTFDYAKERVEKIVTTHQPTPPLSKEQDEEIDAILKEAREYYQKKGMI